MIGIRADGNDQIGIGHLSRCLSIAQKLRERGVEPCFICSKDSMIDCIQKMGFTIIISGSKSKEWSLPDEVDSVIRAKVSALIIDSYYVYEEVFSELHKITKIMFIDDLVRFDYDVDVIINYNIEASKHMYSNTQYTDRSVFTGIEYFPIKYSLKKKNKDINKEIRHVLITTGGTDPFHCTKTILSELLTDNNKEIKFWIIVGVFYAEEYKKELKESYSEYDNVVFLNWGQNMEKLYCDSDLVIAPGSTTIYEALSFGVPCISFQFAENQRDECNALDEMQLVPFAGDYSMDNKIGMMDRIFSNEKNFSVRKKRFDRFVHIFDGKGSDRIVNIVLDLDDEDKI